VQRASQLLQAGGLQYAVESDRRRAPRCSMVLPWQLNESFPNAWCTSCVDYRGEPKPAYHAVARAFAPRRATIRTDRSAWSGHETASAEAWLWSEPCAGGTTDAGGTVTLRLCTLSGVTLAETSSRLGAIGDPVAVAALAVPLAGARAAGESIVLWEARWCDADGRVIDDERALASVSDDLGGLLELERAEIETRLVPGAGPDSGFVRVRHVGGPAVVGLRVTDARPVDAAGWAVIDGDPRPLMPGEERRFAVRWRGDAEGDAPMVIRRLGVESWNAGPVLLEWNRSGERR